MLLERLDQIEVEAQGALAEAAAKEDLEAWRRNYLGKKSGMRDVLASLGQLPKEERPAVGQRANQIRQTLEQAFEARREAVRQEEIEASLTAAGFTIEQRWGGWDSEPLTPLSREMIFLARRA